MTMTTRSSMRVKPKLGAGADLDRSLCTAVLVMPFFFKALYPIRLTADVRHLYVKSLT